MSDLIKELDELLNKYDLTIYDAMAIYKRQHEESFRTTQYYEDEHAVWTYFVSGQRNPCGCGSNCYHHEYDRRDGKIYGVCNACDTDIYIINEGCEEEELEIGIWK